MGTMSWISHLCETNKRDELVIEVSDLAKQLGKPAEEVADEFLEAHNKMRDERENPAFTELNEIHDNMQKKAKERECVICDGEIKPEPVSGWEHGYNAEPVAEGQCCKVCDDNIVIPERIRRAYSN
jgi:hypothetical protein